LRILQTIKRFDFGGAENHVRVLSNELANLNHEVFIFSFESGRQTNMLNPKVTFLGFCAFCGTLFFSVFKLIRIIRKHKIQLVHAHQRLPILSASIAGYIMGVPVVATVHGRTGYDIRSRVSRAIPRSIIFVSRTTLEKSDYYNQIKAKSVLVNNGISDMNNNSIFIPYGIGYVSRIDSKHACVIGHLIDLMPSIANANNTVTLSIFGGGKELNYIKEKAIAVNRTMGREVVIIHGFVENLGSMELFPELILGVGRVAIEAAARGCSVISANANRLGDLITPENYQFYSDNNFVNVNGSPPTAQTLYHQIVSFYENRVENRNKSLELCNVIHRDYNSEVVAKKITSLYSSALL